jgi:hypothetical protein
MTRADALAAAADSIARAVPDVAHLAGAPIAQRPGEPRQPGLVEQSGRGRE